MRVGASGVKRLPASMVSSPATKMKLYLTLASVPEVQVIG